jgi:glycosyltransferase involved in cell wall biosynthesis
MKEYAAEVGELHIIVLSDKKHSLMPEVLASNLKVYPTNSYINYLRPRDAIKLGREVINANHLSPGQAMITADSVEGAWAGLKLKEMFNLPVELQIHTEIFSSHFRGFQNRVRKSYAKKILKNVDAVRVVTEALRMEIEPLTQAPITVLPIYVDKEKIINEPVQFDLHAQYGWHFVLLTVARLAPEKNLGLMLEVLAQIRTTFPSTGLVIVGSGSEEANLKTKARNLGLDGFVAFVGWQEHLASFYKTADIYLQTSFYEGYGLSLVEAGLSNLPVVTTPVGIAGELTHAQDALIFPVYTPKLFIEGITGLIENPSKRENLRVNLKHTLEKKLLSKEDYLKTLKENWERIAKIIK